MKKYTKKQCFEAFNTRQKNPRWSWSARSDDGKTVAVTFWQDRFEDGGRVYRSYTHSSDYTGHGTPGHTELIENLAWARDYCNGELNVIIAIAQDRKASPRAILECFPNFRFKMRILQLAEDVGDFAVERLEETHRHGSAALDPFGRTQTSPWQQRWHPTA